MEDLTNKSEVFTQVMKKRVTRQETKVYSQQQQQ